MRLQYALQWLSGRAGHSLALPGVCAAMQRSPSAAVLSRGQRCAGCWPLADISASFAAQCVLTQAFHDFFCRPTWFRSRPVPKAPAAGLQAFLLWYPHTSRSPCIASPLLQCHVQEGVQGGKGAADPEDWCCVSLSADRARVWCAVTLLQGAMRFVGKLQTALYPISVCPVWLGFLYRMQVLCASGRVLSSATSATPVKLQFMCSACSFPDRGSSLSVM